MTIQNKFSKRGSHFTGWKTVASIKINAGITAADNTSTTYGFTIYATDGSKLRFNCTEEDVTKFLNLIKHA